MRSFGARGEIAVVGDVVDDSGGWLLALLLLQLELLELELLLADHLEEAVLQVLVSLACFCRKMFGGANDVPLEPLVPAQVPDATLPRTVHADGAGPQLQ